MEAEHYTDSFYNSQMSMSYHSAKEIVPLLIEYINPASVLDVGCGVGVWLKVFEENSITNFVGIDGDYVDKKLLAIPAKNFMDFDLKKSFSLNRKFDLAMSLEVGEHLPEDVANTFVDSISSHSDVVFFSAAVPGQIGTYHINEQWQDYWVKKFLDKGFVPIDLVRDKVWYTKSVDWWYKQNCILYVRKSALDNYPKLKTLVRSTNPKDFVRYHPEMDFSTNMISNPFSRLLKYPFYTIKKVLSYSGVIK